MPDPSLQAEPIVKTLVCTACSGHHDYTALLNACPACGGRLRHVVEGRAASLAALRSDSDSMWRYASLLPLDRGAARLSHREGFSPVVELPELSDALHGARLSLKLDCVQNPTGTFKDREASLVISRCVARGLDRLVFYSTGNTGRAYVHYAASAGLSTCLFVPAECGYKQTRSMARTARNLIVSVEDDYAEIAPYAKAFAAENGLTLVAPLHDRTEAYASLAYEQAEQMPDCDFFAQTIASGMGPIGFVRGHQHLIRLGLQTRARVPRPICIQSSESNAMTLAYRAGKSAMTRDDLPAKWEGHRFEPTLNSTNPVNNYPDLRECLQDTNGLITDVVPAFVEQQRHGFERALEAHGIDLDFELEKSLLIGYAGLVRLADEGAIGGARVLLLGTGRGRHRDRALMPPDLTIKPARDDPRDVAQRLGLYAGNRMAV